MGKKNNNYAEAEELIRTFFAQEKGILQFNNKRLKVDFVGKPKRGKGEPKTDIFVRCLDESHHEYDIKISYKKANADFVENKTSAERAKAIFGDNWDAIIYALTSQIKSKFEQTQIVFKTRTAKTNAGSITLGWKFELTNKTGGQLSAPAVLTHEQKCEVFSGKKLPEEKRNAYVNGVEIENSGVAEYVLYKDNVKSAQEVLDNLVPIDVYVNDVSFYFACKALNYRTFEGKDDGDRPLAVQVLWKVMNGKLTPELKFDSPLTKNGAEVRKILLESMRLIGAQTTNDLNSENCSVL